MSFVVIGNNVALTNAMHTQQISTPQLMTVIQEDIRIHGLKRSTVTERLNLFPAITSSRDIQLPDDVYPLDNEENEEPSSETSSSSPQNKIGKSRKGIFRRRRFR